MTDLYEGWATAAEIIFEPLAPSVQIPTRATEYSAGYDLRAFLFGRKVTVWDLENETTGVYCPTDDPKLVLPGGARAMVPLGFKAQLPSNYEAQVRPRSGNAIKKGLGIINAPGTIDADFPGEWAVLLVNHSRQPISIAHGDAIAQMVLAKFEVLPFRAGTVGVTTNRVGGYGSTGI